MTTSMQATYIGRTNAPARSLAEVKIADITTKVDAFTADIDRTETNIARLAESLRGAYQHPEKARVVSDDLEAAQRQLALLKSLREAAIADRGMHEREVRAQGIIAARNEWDKVMSQRVSRSRDLVAIIQSAAALIVELDDSIDTALQLFARPLEGGLDWNAMSRSLRRQTTQGFVDEIFARSLPIAFWDAARPVLGYQGTVDGKLPDYIDGERRAGLATIDLALERVARGQVFGTKGAQDWTTRTTAEAHAAGLQVTVLCSDGYYVPGA